MGIGQDLLDMKAKIDLHKKDKSQSEGALKVLQSRLLGEFQLKSYDEACDYVDELETECKEDEIELKDTMVMLRKKFDV